MTKQPITQPKENAIRGTPRAQSSSSSSSSLSSSSPSPTSPSPTSAGLAHLANYLEAQQGEILESWIRAVNADERIKSASRLSRTEFEDSIPATIRLLAAHLKSRPIETEESDNGAEDGINDGPVAEWVAQSEAHLAHAHGFHRWQEGYSIQELTIEWAHLHAVLVQALNRYEQHSFIDHSSVDHSSIEHSSIEHSPVERASMHLGRLVTAQLMNIGFSHSVTEYHRLKEGEAREVVESLSSALKELSALEKQRGQVLREAVHDLKGSLSAARAATQLLEMVAGSDPEVQTTSIQLLQRSTSTLQQMLNELLDLARLEAGQETLELQPTDSSQVLRELCEETEPLARTKGLYLRCDGPVPFPVESDPLKLRRIAQNLLLNAIKYTRTGGVTLGWVATDDNNWVLSVSDTGPGLASVKNEGQYPNTLLSGAPRGEGVGLVIVKRLCNMLEAQLSVKSEEGVGTTVSVSWPKRYSDGPQ